MKFLSTSSVSFNVRSGGHSTSGASAAPTPDGAVLDLSLINSVKVNPSSTPESPSTVTFGAGCRWGVVDAALWEHGLATVGGTVSHTGVGGLILGGGYGLLSGQRGLCIDALIEVEIVLADGTVKVVGEASEDEEDKELFWGVRGAGQTLGVATSFTSRAWPQKEVWGGIVAWPLDRLEALLEWTQTSFVPRATGKEMMLVVLTTAPPMPGSDPSAPRPPVCMASLFYDGTEAEGKAWFSGMFDTVGTPAIDMTAKQSYPVANSAADMAFPVGGRWLMGGANATAEGLTNGTFRKAADVLFEAKRLALEEGNDMRGSVMGIEMIPPAAIRAVNPTATAFNSRGDYYNIVVVLSWTEATQEADDAARQLCRRLTGIARDGAGVAGDKTGGEGVGQYPNYAMGDLSAEEGFGGNAARLRKLKDSVDPANLFRKNWKVSSKDVAASA